MLQNGGGCSRLIDHALHYCHVFLCSSPGRVSHAAVSHGSQSMYVGKVHAEQYHTFISTLHTLIAEKRKRAKDGGGAAGSKRYHHTPAFVLALALAAMQQVRVLRSDAVFTLSISEFP